MTSSEAISKELVLLECPTLIFKVEETLQMPVPLVLQILIPKIKEQIRNGLYDYDKVWEGRSTQFETWPIVYRIFIDRIEFDLKALDVYIKGMDAFSGRSILPNLAKTIAENDEIPEILYFKEITDIKLLWSEVHTGWLKVTTTGSDCYEITFKGGKKIILPLEIGAPVFLNSKRFPNLPKLHLWWKELRDGKIPEGLMAYTYYSMSRENKAKEKEKFLDYDAAIRMWEDLGKNKEAARVRKLKAEQGAVKVDQTVVHGDYVDDRDTIIKDSVVSKSSIGAGGDGDDLAAKLQQLAQMHRDGILSDEQFEAAKNKLLN